jgi:hypothetical protein
VRAWVARLPAITFAALLICASGSGCAARGHVATPEEIARLQKVEGLSASGLLSLAGPSGRFRTRVVLGVSRPDAVRIEIPSGTGLRFLLVARGGRLRAELPGDGVAYEGVATAEVMDDLFGIDFEPRDLVAAVLGNASPRLSTTWRFDRGRPSHTMMKGSDGRTLALSLDDAELAAPPAAAFEVLGGRGQSVTLREMSDRLGLRR